MNKFRNPLFVLAPPRDLFWGRLLILARLTRFAWNVCFDSVEMFGPGPLTVKISYRNHFDGYSKWFLSLKLNSKVSYGKNPSPDLM